MTVAFPQKRLWCASLLLFFLYLNLIYLGCSQSPFEEEISFVSSSQLRGNISLENLENSEGIYVWLEGIDLSTFTDASGNFQLNLPKSIPQSFVADGGVFNIYFFVANYRLATSTIVIKDGELIHSRGDVNNDGELIGSRSLEKLLNIETEVVPEQVDENYEGVISVTVALQALKDSVDVVLPKLFSHFSDAVVLRRTKTEEAFLLPMNENEKPSFSVERIGQEIRELKYDFYLRAGMLSIGEYEIVPFLMILQSNLPSGLLPSLGLEIEMEISPDFLKIPFRRKGGDFEVTVND